MGVPLLVQVGNEVWDRTEAGGGFTDRAEDRSELHHSMAETQHQAWTHSVCLTYLARDDWKTNKK